MPRMTPECIREVEKAFREYEREVEDSKLRLSTKNTYLLHARQFVKWLKGEFEPGGTL